MKNKIIALTQSVCESDKVKFLELNMYRENDQMKYEMIVEFVSREIHINGGALKTIIDMPGPGGGLEFSPGADLVASMVKEFNISDNVEVAR